MVRMMAVKKKKKGMKDSWRNILPVKEKLK